MTEFRFVAIVFLAFVLVFGACSVDNPTDSPSDGGSGDSGNEGSGDSGNDGSGDSGNGGSGDSGNGGSGGSGCDDGSCSGDDPDDPDDGPYVGLSIDVTPNGGFFASDVDGVTIDVSGGLNADDPNRTFDIRYTLNGTKPDTSSSEYTSPISIPKPADGGIVTLWVFASDGTSTGESKVHFSFDKLAPDFTLTRHTGADLSLSDFKGTSDYVHLNFSSVTCLQCTMHSDILSESIQHIKDLGHSFESVTILVVNGYNQDPTSGDLKGWASRYDLTYVVGDKSRVTYNTYSDKFGNADGSTGKSFPYQVFLKYNSSKSEFECIYADGFYSPTKESFVNRFLSLVE